MSWNGSSQRSSHVADWSTSFMAYYAERWQFVRSGLDCSYELIPPARLQRFQQCARWLVQHH